MMGGLGALRGIGQQGTSISNAFFPQQMYSQAQPTQAPTRAGAMPPAMRGRMGV